MNTHFNTNKAQESLFPFCPQHRLRPGGLCRGAGPFSGSSAGPRPAQPGPPALSTARAGPWLGCNAAAAMLLQCCNAAAMLLSLPRKRRAGQGQPSSRGCCRRARAWLLRSWPAPARPPKNPPSETAPAGTGSDLMALCRPRAEDELFPFTDETCTPSILPGVRQK